MGTKNNKEEMLSPAQDPDANLQPSPETESEPGSPTRRELIERYGKYAIIGAPLLVFVSQARAIKSKP